jgi:hypothetical protein
MSNDLIALQEFVMNNHELEELEDKLQEFNIFEVLGMIKQEIKHSNFLSWLLNPKENQSIGDYLLKRLFKKAAFIGQQNGIGEVTPIDIDVWDLNQINVYREWNNIDLLLEDSLNQFVCVIENKVFSEEHSNQLSKYRDIIESYYPNHKKMYILFSPEGVIPQETGEADYYVPLSYKELDFLVEQLINTKHTVLSDEIVYLISHYSRLLRRHIMEDAELIKLAQRIYTKHKKALDIIYNYKPDLQADISNYLIKKIENNSALIPDVSSKTYIRFTIPDFVAIPELNKGKEWTRNGRSVLFEFRNDSSGLKLVFIIGPGDKDIRNKIFDEAQKHQDIFNNVKKQSERFSTIYTKTILKKKDLEDEENLYQKIDDTFAHFLDSGNDLDKIKKVISKIIY